MAGRDEVEAMAKARLLCAQGATRLFAMGMERIVQSARLAGQLPEVAGLDRTAFERSIKVDGDQVLAALAGLVDAAELELRTIQKEDAR